MIFCIVNKSNKNAQTNSNFVFLFTFWFPQAFCGYIIKENYIVLAVFFQQNLQKWE